MQGKWWCSSQQGTRTQQGLSHAVQVSGLHRHVATDNVPLCDGCSGGLEILSHVLRQVVILCRHHRGLHVARVSCVCE